MELDKKYYEKMIYQKSGASGLSLPRISLGLWHNFGSISSYKNMQELIFTAFSSGITYFDLANNYGPEPGRAEINFGRILKENLKAHRDEMIIATKAGYKMWDGPYGDFGSRKYLMASIDQSLERLNLDYVDIFYHHRMDPNTPLEETMLALRDIVLQGKALYVGLSNYDGKTLKKACTILDELHVPFIINQNKYNIFDRTIEKNGLLEMTKELKKGLAVFSPLEQGILSDRYLNGIPSDSRVKVYPVFLNESKLTDEVLKKVRDLNELASSLDMKLSTFALNWILSQEGVTTCIIGASRPEQIIENCKAVGYSNLSSDVLSKVEEIVNG